MTENDRGTLSVQARDINSKTVFGNPILCAQFLRDNVNIPCLKDVQPEDIEDVSQRYIPYLGTQYESDTVKRIQIHRKGSTARPASKDVSDSSGGQRQEQEPLFIVSLTEHKSRVDYDVSMQLLKYMLCIWLDYEKEMESQEEGAAKRKSFRYPAIIPIVYYEGKAEWTAERQFRARISRGEEFSKWIPDFTYEVIRLHDYSNEELLERGNEMSLIMLFNKIQDAIDISDFLELPKGKLDEMIRDTPEGIMDIIVSVMESLCRKIGATQEETQKCVNRVKERRMGYLFENIEKMDIQAERRNTAQAREELAKARAEAEKTKEEAEKAKADVEKARAEAEKTKESVVKSIIHVCRDFNSTKEQAVQALMRECGIDEKQARQKADRYWES